MVVNLGKELLLQIRKPGRYIGEEFNSVKKDPAKCKIKIALAFPDIYEIGMSNLGLRILYDILNRQEDILCERVFCPWIDMEALMRKEGIKLFSLENKLTLDEFDLIGFSINNELTFTNILTMLDLAGIPIKAKDRQANHPLVIAGGMSCLNPGPLKEIFDAFCIGEAEELILEIAEVLKVENEKQLRLESLSKLEGVFVPAYFDGKPKIKKRFIKDLSESRAPKKWIVPYLQIVHDRVAVELMRGCPNQCRFCQSRSSYWPLRIRSKDDVVKIACETIENTGYEELSLLSLSSSDHPQIVEIYEELIKRFDKNALTVALPSIRAKSKLKDILPMWAKNNKTTITLAPEAGSQRLRDLINKNVSIEELIDCAETAFQNGWRSLKLYFMIGLPTETDEDLKEMAELIIRLALLGKTHCKGAFKLNVSINTFIPKSHTPFQWCEVISQGSARAKKKLINETLRELKSKNNLRFPIELKFHDENMGLLEAVLARGDEKIFAVIYEAWLNGARFDAWASELKFDIWDKAFKSCGINLNEYLLPGKLNQALPWDYIDIGISKENLQKEYLHAIAVTSC